MVKWGERPNKEYLQLEKPFPRSGEVVEEALDYKASRGDSGPLLPLHLREAVRRLKRRGGGNDGNAKVAPLNPQTKKRRRF